jgi:hypothetical protein
MNTYTVNTWNSSTGRMDLRATVSTQEEAAAMARTFRAKGLMPFAYDENGRSLYLPR